MLYAFKNQSIILLAVEHNLYKGHWNKSLKKKVESIFWFGLYFSKGEYTIQYL